jgi:hypothetical protein
MTEGRGTVLDGRLAAKDSENLSSKRGLRLRICFVIAVVIIATVATAGWMLRYELITFRAFTDKDSYKPGESIKVVARFTNCGLFPVSLTFATSLRANSTVYSADGSYICGIRQYALMYFTRSNLGPGESATSWAYWDQTYYSYDYHEDQVPCPCDYYIEAGTLCREFHATAMTALFTISAKPASYETSMAFSEAQTPCIVFPCA